MCIRSEAIHTNYTYKVLPPPRNKQGHCHSNLPYYIFTYTVNYTSLKLRASKHILIDTHITVVASVTPNLWGHTIKWYGLAWWSNGLDSERSQVRILGEPFISHTFRMMSSAIKRNRVRINILDGLSVIQKHKPWKCWMSPQDEFRFNASAIYSCFTRKKTSKII